MFYYFCKYMQLYVYNISLPVQMFHSALLHFFDHFCGQTSSYLGVCLGDPTPTLNRIELAVCPQENPPHISVENVQ